MIKYAHTTKHTHTDTRSSTHSDERTHLSSVLRAKGTTTTDSDSGYIFIWGIIQIQRHHPHIQPYK